MEPVFHTLIEQSRKDLRTRYRHGILCRAEPLFDAEVAMIQGLNFEEALVQMADFGEQLRRRELYFHAIGSGCSSIVLYVLGLTHINPIQHDTHFQRFWQTSSGEPPILQLVVDSIGKPGFGDVFQPKCISAHVMTRLEAIPSRVEAIIGSIKITKLDQATLATLQAGDTKDVFQFHDQRAKWLLNQIRPTSIEELAVVTTLEQLSHGHPDVVISYLEQYREILDTRYVTGHRASPESRHRLPVLFQESLMSQLRHMAKLFWDDTYPFVRDAAKGRMNDQHVLWKSAIGKIETSSAGSTESVLRTIAESSRWALCRAHQVANALTSYRAAYCRTHHRVEFEKVQEQLTESAEQGK